MKHQLITLYTSILPSFSDSLGWSSCRKNHVRYLVLCLKKRNNLKFSLPFLPQCYECLKVRGREVTNVMSSWTGQEGKRIDVKRLPLLMLCLPPLLLLLLIGDDDDAVMTILVFPEGSCLLVSSRGKFVSIIFVAEDDTRVISLRKAAYVRYPHPSIMCISLWKW